MIKIIVDKNGNVYPSEIIFKNPEYNSEKLTPLYMNFLTQCLKLFQQLKLTMESR